MFQQRFREELGLIVEKPKQGGYGSSNDGNTARRFFENCAISARITEVDEDLIQRFYIVCQVISCGYEIDVQKFKDYSIQTARKFVELYPWYYMPTSVHKILIHGSKIIESSLLPIGQMSEEAQEACNKYINNYREHFVRKCSCEKNMEDIFHLLLIRSDPVITSLTKLPQKKLKKLSSQVLELIVAPEVSISNPDCEKENVTGDHVEILDDDKDDDSSE